MESQKNGRFNLWVFALIASVALNGLFAGYYLSNKTATPLQVVDPNGGQTVGQQRDRQRRATMPRQANRLVRHLPRERQKEVMRAAFAKLPKTDTQHPRELMQNRVQLRRRLTRAMRTDPLDKATIQSLLAQTRALNETLARQSDALIVAILAEMTPEERAQIRDDRRRNQRRKK